MIKTLRVLAVFIASIIIASTRIASAEGTKELQPASGSPSHLLINGGASTNTGNNFGYLSSTLEKLYIHIKDFTTERIYFGFQAPANTYMRIKDPSGAIVYGPVLLPSAAGPGYINNYTEGYNGPGVLAAGGYSALSYDPAVNGDYTIEFNDGSATAGNNNNIDIPYYDITVGNKSTLKAITGRLYAYLWALTTTGSANPSNATFYAYTSDNVVTTLNLNGMQPYVYGVYCNRTGIFNTGNVTTDRQSRGSIAAPLPEYKIFLNDPDPTDYPSAVFPTLTSPPNISGCAASGYCVEVDIDKIADAEVFIDLNGNGKYDAGTVDVKLNKALSAGSNCIPWDGKNGLGITVLPGTVITGYVRAIAGLTNFPVWDAENNTSGVNVAIVRPSASPPLVFWDDSQISGGTSNLTGANSPAHTWSGNFGDVRLLNTWWYTFTINQTFTYTITSNCPPIANPDNVNGCLNAAVTFNPLANDTDSENNIAPNSVSIVTQPTSGTAIVNAGGTITYTPNTGFMGSDVIVYQVCDATGLCSSTAGTGGQVSINVGPSITLSKTDVCGSATNGTISFTANSTTLKYGYSTGNTYTGTNPPTTSTVVGTNTISGLGAGTYTVRIHNGTCFTDQTVTIAGNALTSFSLSYVAFCTGGTTTVNFNTTTNTYRYDYSSGTTYTGTNPPTAYATVNGTNAINGLSAGNYTVRLVNPATGCFADQTINVAASAGTNPGFGTTSVTNTCGSPTSGAINFNGATNFKYDYTTGASYTGPASPTTYTAVAGTDVITGLPADTYTVRLKDNTTACFTDRTFTVGTNNPVLTLTKTDICGGSGTGRITFPTTTNTLRFNYTSGSTYSGVTPTTATINGTNSITTPGANTYTVRLYNPGNTCFSDQTVTINSSSNPTFTLSKTDVCGTDPGSIYFNTSTGNLKFDYSTGATYSGTNPPTARTTIVGTNYITGISTGGNYTVRLYDASTSCFADQSINIASNAKPTLTLSTTGATCNNGTVTFPTTVTTLKYDYTQGSTYNGTPAPTAFTSVNGTNTIGSLASGPYAVRLYNPTTGCFTDASATVNKTANCPPVAVANSATTLEDNAVVITAIAANDTDTDGSLNLSSIDLDPATLGIQTTFNNAAGSWVLGSGGNVTFTPVANFNGIATATYTIMDNLGATSNAATLTVTVTAVNDAPSFTKGANQTVNEDAGATTVNVWATAINKGAANESGQTLTFTVTNDNNALFSVQPAIDPTTGNLTYTPAANANGTTTVTIVLKDDGGTANGGSDTAPTQTFTITVNAVNDAPSFVKGADQTINEDAGAQSVTGWATSISPGPSDESSQTLTFTLTNNNTSLFTIQPSINASTGTLTYTPVANISGTATVSIVLKDNGGTANGGVDTAPTQTFTITVNPVNDPPSFTKGADQTVNEDAGAQTATNWATSLNKGAPDESAQTLTFTVTNNNNTLFSTQPAIDGTTGTLTYTPAANAFGTATVTVVLKDNGGTANGGNDTAPTQTFTITVNSVNDAPTFTKGADQTVGEDAAAQSVTNWATAISPGPANESGQTVAFTVTNNNTTLFSVQPAISPTGTLTYTLAANATGSATVSVVLKDNGGTANGGVDTSPAQTFTITATAVNDAPGFTKGADQTVLEDAAAQSVTGWATAISAGPPDESSQTLTFTVTNDNNTLFSVQPAVSATGTLTYTLAANADGTANVSVVLKDNGGTANGGVDTSPAQAFVINVTPVNDAPSFTKGADQTVSEDAAAQSVSGWATAISPGPNESGQTVAFTVTNTNNALFAVQPAISATGTLTYTLAANVSGTATVSVVLKDNGGTANGGVDTAPTQTFTITVNSVNDAPSFTKGADQTILEDAAAQSVTGWATAISPGPADESGQTVAFTVTNNNNALFSVQPAISPTGTLTYTLAANANGSATVSVVLKDNGGTANGGVDTSPAQTFAINVTAVNDAPSFTKGADQTVNEDAAAQSVTGWATAISAGPSDESSQTLTFTVTNTNNALFSVQPAISATGTLTYTLAANANGSATVSVTLKDNGGTTNGGVDTSPAQTFAITVNSVNDAPSFTKGADQTVNEDAAAQTVTGWATAISPGPANESGQTLTFTATVANPALFSVQPAIDPTTGNLTYTPAANASGSTTVSVTLKDNGGTTNGGVDTSPAQTFTITLNSVNDAPSFTKGADQTINEDAGAQSVTGWATNISTGAANESGQILTFTATAGTPALFSVQPAIDPTTGNLTFTPAANVNGTTTITVILKDNGGTANGGVDTSPAQTFTITINSVNDAPSFTKGADQTVNEDAAAQSVTNWATAISPGPADESAQTVAFTVTNNNNALFSVQPAIDPVTGNLTYTPAANVNGTTTVTVTLKDNGGTANGGVDTSPAQTFTITINSVNDAPSFTKGADQTINEDAGVQSVTGWATNISAGPANESGQTLTFTATAGTPALFSVQPAIDPTTGNLTYTPAANANGTTTVTVTLKDNGGTANGGVDTSPAQTFTITINSVNDAPSFTKGADQTINEDAGAQSVTGWATNISSGAANESGQTLTFTATAGTPALFSVQPAIDPTTGNLTYTPAANANGTTTVTVTLKDNGGTANGGVDTSPVQTFTITINSVNDAPSFTKGADQTINEDAGAQSVTGWATNISAGPANESGQTLTFTATAATPALFSVQPAIDPTTGNLTYTPAANANGTTTVTVTLKDNGGTANGGVDTSPAQTFTITINSVNDAPSFTKGADQTINEDAGAQSVTGWATNISAGPANESGQTLTFTATAATPALFSVQPVINPTTGTLTYTPAANANGTTTVTVTLKDNGGTANGGVDTSPAQTFTITINSVNDAPSFTKGADQTVAEDAGAQSVTGWATNISAGAANESGQTLTFTATAGTPALFSVQPAIDPTTGNLTYTPAANANGTTTVTVTLKDNGGTANGGVDTSPAQTFTITINSVNDAPSFTKGADQTINEDAGAQSVTGWATNISAGPANESGQTLTFTATAATPALFSVQPAIDPATGNLTYTPAANANGTTTVTVTLKDNGGTANGGVDTSPAQTFTITINSVNDAPSFTKGADQTVGEDAGAQSVTGWATNISAGAANESSQTLTFNATNNNNALFSVQPAIDPITGNLTYTPASNANGTATVSVALKDNGGTANGGVDTSPTQTFTITVTPVNDPPSFTKGTDPTVNEDAGAQSVTGWATNISKGGPDESGQTLTFTATASNTTLFSVQPAIDPTTGTLTFTPAANANGTTTVTVTLKDNGGTANGGVDTSPAQTFTITINSVNDAPSFTKGADQTVGEDAGAQTVNGWATNISAGAANESSQTLTFTATNTNNALFSVQPAIDPITGNLTYTPAANANGTATVSVVLKDNGGTANGGVDTSPAQTFTITVNAVNDAPSFTKGADPTVNEDAGAQTITGWATNISAGAPDESGQTLTFNVTNTNNALFSVQPAIDPATGTLTFTPAANAFGTVTVSVALKDNGGTANGGNDTSPTQTFTITLNPVNDAPSFTKGADQTIGEDAGAQTVNTWATNISPGAPNESSQTLTFTVTNNNNALFSTQPAIDPTTGNLTYTPAANANGTAVVTVVLKDNGGTANGGVDTSPAQTFNITINGVNDAPSFTKGTDPVVNEDAGAQTITGWATNISAGAPDESSQTLTFNVTNTNNALFSVQPAIDPVTGTLTFTPAADVFGTVTVSVALKDNGGTANGGSDTSPTQTFTITLNPVNDAPSFTKGANQNASENTGAHSVTGWATNISPGAANESGQTLTFIVTNDNNALFAVQPAIDPTTGTLTYTLASDETGSATVTVVLKDNGGTANGGTDSSPAQTFTINVISVNQAPSFVKGADQTVLEDAGAQSVTGWATGISKGGTDEGSQVLTFAVTNTDNTLFAVQPAIDPATGTLTYTPAANAYGTVTVSVTLKDDGGTANGGSDTSPTQTFTLTLTPVNDSPSFTKGPDQNVIEDAGPQTINGWATGIAAGPNESGQTLTLTVTNDNNALFATQPSIDPSTGTLTYTPAANASGTATVTVTLKDNGGTSNGGTDTYTQTFTINLGSKNDAPTFTSGGDVTVNEDAGAQTVNAWATNISPGAPDESSQVLTFAITNSNNALFTVQPSIDPATGNLTYTLAPNASGTVTVTVVLKDDGGTANGGSDTSAPQTFTINITEINDVPTLADATISTQEDSPAVYDPSGDFADIEGPMDPASVDLDPLTPGVQGTFTNTAGTWTTDGSGKITYIPAADFNGTATLQYTVSDEDGAPSNIATLSVTVDPVNDAPVVTNKTALVANDAPFSGTILSSTDKDPDGTPLTVSTTPVSGPAHGTITINADGTYVYTPDPGYVGTDVIVVEVCDGGLPLPAQCVDVTLTASVIKPGGTPPVVSTATASVNENAASGTPVLTVNATDSDAGDVLTYAITSGNGAGAFAIDPVTGAITVANPAVLDYETSPVFTIVVTVTDLQGNSSTATITINLIDVNEGNNGDADGDGIPDSVEIGPDANNPLDTDGDGIPDYRDTDSDNDGIPDSVEAGPNPASPVDSDNDGVPDYRDVDSDNDGIPDNVEAGTNPASPADSDGDGTPNYQDTDSDNDGVPDSHESGGPLPTGNDADHDGIDDAYDPDLGHSLVTDPKDTDGDGIPDYIDPDDDGDGIPTADEDSNGNGNFEDDDCEGDGTPDYLDSDQCKIKPEAGFSPNGDGNADVWIIHDIEQYPNNKVKVFNRWGNVVFDVKGYNNNDRAWNGSSNGKWVILSDLNVPDGTYFYSIDLGDGSKSIGGFIVLKR